MEELRAILLLHPDQYPLMEPADAVKLIYQNEFGCGHMITDPSICLSYLHQEYHEAKKAPIAVRWEPIGNGFARIYLSSLTETELEALGQAFLHTGATHHGSLAQFLHKLDVLRDLTTQGQLPFDLAALDAYLIPYAQSNYPAVSHSESYRNTYHPAYRVVLTSLEVF